jgi:hypothetical protein
MDKLVIFVWPVILLWLAISAICDCFIRSDWKSFPVVVECRGLFGSRRYWPTKVADRSLLLLCMHLMSVIERSISGLQFTKFWIHRFSESRPNSKVPIVVVEMYALCWIGYLILIANNCQSLLPNNRTLSYILAWRMFGIVHGHVYYTVLKNSYYTVSGWLYSVGRSVLLVIVSYCEFILCFACFVFTKRSDFLVREKPLVVIGEAVYFSAVSLSTTGYGDVVPVTMDARLYTSLAVFGSFLLNGVAVARLIGSVRPFKERVTPEDHGGYL